MLDANKGGGLQNAHRVSFAPQTPQIQLYKVIFWLQVNLIENIQSSLYCNSHSMAKRVAECIIDLLESDKNDLKTFYTRTSKDWKYLLHKDIKHNMCSGAHSLKLDINKYVNCMEKNYESSTVLFTYHGFPVRSFTDSPEERSKINLHIAELKEDKTILWFLGVNRPAARITSSRLQELIDYCRRLDLRIVCYRKLDLEIHINWNHWNHNHLNC